MFKKQSYWSPRPEILNNYQVAQEGNSNKYVRTHEDNPDLNVQTRVSNIVAKRSVLRADEETTATRSGLNNPNRQATSYSKLTPILTAVGTCSATDKNTMFLGANTPNTPHV